MCSVSACVARRRRAASGLSGASEKYSTAPTRSASSTKSARIVARHRSRARAAIRCAASRCSRAARASSVLPASATMRWLTSLSRVSGTARRFAQNCVERRLHFGARRRARRRARRGRGSRIPGPSRSSGSRTLRPPAMPISPSTRNSLLCMRWLNCEKQHTTPAANSSGCVTASSKVGLYSRNSRFACARAMRESHSTSSSENS